MVHPVAQNICYVVKTKHIHCQSEALHWVIMKAQTLKIHFCYPFLIQGIQSNIQGQIL